MNEQNVAIFFNIASLFRCQDFTMTPEQFADNAKNFKKWSAKEDTQLVKAFKKYENNWSRIQEELKIPKKTIDDCKDRYEKLTNANVKGTFSPQEDDLILRNVKKFGRNWALIAKKIEGRSGKQVRERYVNYLEKKDNLYKDTFNEEEEDLIYKYFDLYPHDWNKIAQFITSKSSAQIKKHYVQNLRDKKLETNSTISGSISHMRLDFDQVSEIANTVETLVDPIGNFFRQRLSLMKQTNTIQVDQLQDDEDFQTSNWLKKQTSQEDYDFMISQLENQGMLRRDSSNNYGRMPSQGKQQQPLVIIDSFAGSQFNEEQSAQQDPEYNSNNDYEYQQNMPQSSLETTRQSSQRHSDIQSQSQKLSLQSKFKPQLTKLSIKTNSLQKNYMQDNQKNKNKITDEDMFIKQDSVSNITYSSTGLTLSSNSMQYAFGQQKKHHFGDKTLFDFDQLLNNDKSDCDSMFNFSSNERTLKEEETLMENSVKTNDTFDSTHDTKAPSLDISKSQQQTSNLIIVKVKLVSAQQIEVEIDFNSDMNISDFKAIAFKDLPNKENTIIKLIYQGKLLTDDKLMRDLNLKINPYIHANIVQVEPQSEVVDEEANGDGSVVHENDYQFNNMDVLANYLRVLEEQQANLREISSRMRQDVSITRPRSQQSNEQRRYTNGRANRFANRFTLRNRLRQDNQQPRIIYGGGSSMDGTCIDFLWGFLLGFIFPLIFIIMILLCRIKKLAKTEGKEMEAHEKMGQCGCSREKLGETKDAAIANISKAGEYTRVKYHETKNYIGPIIQEKYEDSKMKYQSYRPEKIDDSSKTKAVTKFEETLPLKKMTVEDFERRIKKFGIPKAPGSQDVDKINEVQLIETFKDFFPEIEKEGSLIRQLLLNPCFAVQRNDESKLLDGYENQFNIPELLLLGNMYCANTPYYRAQKFFEVCQEELQPQISNNDGELADFVKKQFDIAYYTMMRLYNVAKDPKEQAIPEEWLNLDEETVAPILEVLYDAFLDEVFGSSSKLTSEDFIEKLRNDHKQWLQPHYLRARFYQQAFEPKAIEERKL